MNLWLERKLCSKERKGFWLTVYTHTHTHTHRAQFNFHLVAQTDELKEIILRKVYHETLSL
jgi:hypothetical protein